MVDEVYKLNLSLQVMKEQREKMISDLESADKLWLPGANDAATMIADGIKKSA